LPVSFQRSAPGPPPNFEHETRSEAEGALPHDDGMSEPPTIQTEISAQLDAIERRVAAAIDIGVLLALRGDLIEILSGMPDRQSLRPLSKRGHALRRQTEIVIGELLILLKRLGLRHDGQGGIRKGATRPPSLRDMGVTRRRAAIWQARARAAPAPSFNLKIVEATTIAEIHLLTDELDRLARVAHRHDTTARDRHRAARAAAERKGGGMLLASGGQTNAEMGLTKTPGRRWRRYALMTDAVFTAALVNGEWGARAKKVPAPTKQTETIISPWSLDDFGCPTREITAVEVQGAANVGAAE